MVKNPTLSFVLAVQSNVLESIIHHPVLEGRGLLARFLYAVPTSIIGGRSYDTLPIPEDIEHDFKALIDSLLSVPVPDTPITLTLSPRATEVIRAYFQQVESALKKETSIKNWLAKHIGSVLRISGNLHLVSEERGQVEISDTTLKSAIVIGKYFGSHARYCFTSATGEGEILKAQEILKIIFKLSRNSLVTRRELYRQGGKRNLQKVDELLPYLDLLEDYGYIKQIQAPLSPTATRPSDIIYIHPNYKP